MGFASLIRRGTLDTSQRTLVGTVVTANDDGSYDVMVHEVGAVLPRLYRAGREIAMLAPGDDVLVRVSGAAVQLL